MSVVEPHVHMVARTTDDYQAMALAGIRIVTEPAFWAGFDRGGAAGFADYFRSLTTTEPARAARYGMDHYCWICLNPKEAEDLGLAKEVLAILPEFLDSPRSLGIGEIGLNKNSRNELEVFERHLELAARRGELVLVHTPHLEDKLKGTRLILDAIANQPGIDPDRVIVDHAEEHTIAEIRERGCWVGLTLYPNTKCTPARAADIIERHGAERLWVDSAADWGPSDPLATVKAARELLRRGHPEDLVEQVFWRNPLAFIGQSGKLRRR